MQDKKPPLSLGDVPLKVFSGHRRRSVPLPNKPNYVTDATSLPNMAKSL